MPYSFSIYERICEYLPNVPTKRMFGGIVFFVRGHSVVGVFRDTMMARVGVERATVLLQLPGVMPFAKHPNRMRGFVQVSESFIDRDDVLESLIDDALRLNAQL